MINPFDFTRPDGFPAVLGAMRIQFAFREVDLSAANILDVGCSDGCGARFLVNKLNAKAVIGIDVDANLIEVMNNHATNRVRGIHLTTKQYPFDSNIFDIVFAKDSPMAMTNKDIFLSESYRVLKPGGYLLIDDLLLPNQESRTVLFQTICSTYNLLTEDLFRQKLTNAGFTCCAIINYRTDMLKFIDSDHDSIVKHHALIQQTFSLDEIAQAVTLRRGFKKLIERNEVMSVIIKATK